MSLIRSNILKIPKKKYGTVMFGMNSSKIRENHCKNIMCAFLPVFCVTNPYVRNGAHETNNTTIKNFNLNGKGGEIRIKK